jgi:hypothetical protein
MTATAAGIRDAEVQVGRSYDVASQISLLDTNRYPILGILTNAGRDLVRKTGKAIKKVVTKDPKFVWYEDTYLTRLFTGQSTLDPDGGTITLASGGNQLVAGDLLYIVAQGWMVPVVSITSDTAVVCGAELGGATGAAATVVGEVLKVGNASAEGAVVRDISSTTPAEVYNYTQIFRTAAGVTNTELNTDGFIKLNDLDYQKRKAAVEHALDIEYSAIFGKRALTAAAAGVKTKRYSAGILSKIATYKTANVDTEAEFNTWCSTQVFAHGNKEKYLFCSGNALDLVTTFAKNKMQTFQDENTYGILINKIRTPFGTLNVIHHELLSGTVYGNYAIALDMEALYFRFLQNRDTKLLTNRQAPGEDSRIDEYLTECGFQIEQESRHAIMSVGAL